MALPKGEDISGPAYDDVRVLLEKVSDELVGRRIGPTDTAMLIFSLKDALQGCPALDPAGFLSPKGQAQ